MHRVRPRKPRRFTNRPHVGDLAPDGVRVYLDWQRMGPGTSVFIPAIDVVEAVAQFNEAVSRWRWDWDFRIRIENGKMGVRFWRFM